MIVVIERKTTVTIIIDGYKRLYRNSRFDYNTHRVTTKVGLFKVRVVLNCPYVYYSEV